MLIALVAVVAVVTASAERLPDSPHFVAPASSVIFAHFLDGQTIPKRTQKWSQSE
jgi:hypothetical protein